MLHAVIMAGGGGTRFWPRSRSAKPKQFLALVGERTLLQQAADRIEAQVPAEQTWVITAARHWQQVAEQLPHLKADRLIGEPCGRDTAACIGLGAVLIARQDPDATVLVTPADHIIEPADAFRRAVHVAEQMAKEVSSALLTMGVTPTFPATGYGYIHRGREMATRQAIPIYEVQAFKEKPNASDAQRYVSSGEFFWNSGIFLWKVQTILAELQRLQPHLYEGLIRIASAWDSDRRDEVFAREYEQMQKLSIDFAIMENAEQVLVLPAPFQWDDVGSWLAVERMQPQDAQGNTIRAQHCGLDTSGCIIAADEGNLVTTVGVQDLLIVQDGNAILVANKNDEGAVKRLVELLQEKKLENYL